MQSQEKGVLVLVVVHPLTVLALENARDLCTIMLETCIALCVRQITGFLNIERVYITR
jgi:hypothetical protein